ncbi:MAG: DEAD/DEAH box helicase [Thermoplasmatota archaeon]
MSATDDAFTGAPAPPSPAETPNEPETKPSAPAAPTSFSRLSPRIREFLTEEGFTRPTAAQEAAIPVILDGHHTLLIAPTGMGKTESAVIPLFDRLLDLKSGPTKPKGISILYVTPLRALNRDLMGRLEAWGEKLRINVAVRHGDTSQGERNRQSRQPPDMLITTPETLQVLFLGSRLREHLATVKWVVIDEVHELAGDERGAQLAVALERLVGLAGEFQRVGLSATVGDERGVAEFLGGAGRVTRTVKVPVAKRLNLSLLHPDPDARAVHTAEKIMARPEVAAFLNTALDLISSHTSTLLFVNTRETAEVLAARVRMLDPEYPLVIHHGSLSREARLSAEEAFKGGAAKALLCTSSMELGIDIGTADLVIQYASPRQATRLVQRVGRAGHREDLISNGVIIALDPDDITEAAAILERTVNEQLEHFPPHTGPLDVLANQLAAMALAERRVEAGDAYRLVRRSHPFRDLSREEFDRVLEQLAAHAVVWRDGVAFGSGRRTRPYFTENISMIPDAKTFRVVNIATRRAVATLDETFVMSFIEPGASFIAQGQPWRVAEIDEEEAVLRVEPIKDPLGAIPSWIGEEIPVPYEVAQLVGRIRQDTQDHLKDGLAPTIEYLQTRYRLDHGAARTLAEFVDEQEGYALPTDRIITLETGARRCVVNAAWGTKVNETIGRLLSGLLSAKAGTSVGITIDPYRIVLDLPARVTGSDVRKLLMETDPKALPSLMELVLTGSYYLRYRMVQVARKFGAISRDVDYRKISVARLLDLYKGSPLHREALREALHDKLDLAQAAEELRKLQQGEVPIFTQGLSPIGAAGIDQRVELVSPARADRTLLAAMKQRLLGEKVVLLCMNCKDWSSQTRVSRAVETRSCPKCKGILLAPVRPWHRESIDAWKKSHHGGAKLTQEEKKDLTRLSTAANLYLDHKERALIALVARGVGPDTAGRLLAKQRTDEDPFLRDLLEAEITYARTRAFWD